MDGGLPCEKKKCNLLVVGEWKSANGISWRLRDELERGGDNNASGSRCPLRDDDDGQRSSEALCNLVVRRLQSAVQRDRHRSRKTPGIFSISF